MDLPLGRQPAAVGSVLKQRSMVGGYYTGLLRLPLLRKAVKACERMAPCLGRQPLLFLPTVSVYYSKTSSNEFD